MKLKHHELLNGEKVDIQKGDQRVDDLVDWLIKEALQSNSWVSFQQRTANAVIKYAKESDGSQWESNDLYKLQLDFVGQIGITTGELQGVNTATFGSLLLSAVMSFEHSSRIGLLTFLVQAANNDLPIKLENLHLAIFSLRLKNITPFPYNFDIKPPKFIYSDALADDYETIEGANLVQAASPIYATGEGQTEVDNLSKRYINLLPATNILVLSLLPASSEELFFEFIHGKHLLPFQTCQPSHNFPPKRFEHCPCWGDLTIWQI